MSDHLFPEAVTLIKAGDIEKGQRLLMRLVRENPQHERAWLWLVNTTPKQDNQIACLEKVLQINPDHETAKKLLTELKEAKAKAAAEEAKQLEASIEFEYFHAQNGVEQKNGHTPHAPLDVTAVKNDTPSAPTKTAAPLPDPLMVQIEEERAALQEAALREATKKAIHEAAAQKAAKEKLAQEKAAIRVAAIAQAALEQASIDQNGLNGHSLESNGHFLEEVEVSEMSDEEKVEIRIPEKVYEFAGAIVHKTKGAFGFLFKGKEERTKAVIKIAPDVGILQIKAVEGLAQGEQYNLYFHDIKMIDCVEPRHLVFYLHNGKEITLKDVVKFNHVAKLLEPHITVKAKQHFIQTPPPFEQRVSQLV